MKKKSFVIIAFFILVGLSSCNDSSGGCLPELPIDTTRTENELQECECEYKKQFRGNLLFKNVAIGNFDDAYPFTEIEKYIGNCYFIYKKAIDGYFYPCIVWFEESENSPYSGMLMHINYYRICNLPLSFENDIKSNMLTSINV